MKATIIYYSHKGKTAGYAREIAMYLWSKGLDVSLASVSDYKEDKLHNTDFLLLGCWTSGWFIVHQHPHKSWVDFARTLPHPFSQKLLLFTTYKIRTGSMFRKMKKHIAPIDSNIFSLKSRSGHLTDTDKRTLDTMIRQKHINE
ncbi:flavodoxin family protein [Porphyromonas pogonae]|uniref:flavodoxin family protein n=1 Tax=Porphyromonas pogonae TaxID=867595 RepID=UPI002E7A4757|nr:flavodoxin domain-containing protein [Porphyromonas pogonae]